MCRREQGGDEWIVGDSGVTFIEFKRYEVRETCGLPTSFSTRCIVLE